MKCLAMVQKLGLYIGSQVFETMENITESLAGRVSIIDLYPLSTREIYNLPEDVFIPDINIIKNKTPLKYEYLNNVFDRIFRGSYPELYKNNTINLEAFFFILFKNIHRKDNKYPR